VELLIQQPRPEASRSSFKVTGAFALDQVKAIVEEGEKLPQQAKLAHAIKSFQAESRPRVSKLDRNFKHAQLDAGRAKRHSTSPVRPAASRPLVRYPVATAPGAVPPYVPMLCLPI